MTPSPARSTVSLAPGTKRREEPWRSDDFKVVDGVGGVGFIDFMKPVCQVDQEGKSRN